MFGAKTWLATDSICYKKFRAKEILANGGDWVFLSDHPPPLSTFHGTWSNEYRFWSETNSQSYISHCKVAQFCATCKVSEAYWKLLPEAFNGHFLHRFLSLASLDCFHLPSTAKAVLKTSACITQPRDWEFCMNHKRCSPLLLCCSFPRASSSCRLLSCALKDAAFESPVFRWLPEDLCCWCKLILQWLFVSICSSKGFSHLPELSVHFCIWVSEQGKCS